MDFNIDSWLNLTIRWFHVMAGIMWIGTSFFFIWLDNVLQAEPEGGKGHVGKAWLFHGGGFYQVEKSLVAPPSILKSLHWFKWEAYLTWLSGFALLVVVYWWRADIYMIDPTVAKLSIAESIGVGLGTLVVGWLVYDSLWRALGERAPKLALGISLALYVVAAYALTHLLSGRAAFTMSGAMLGTIMAANVAMVIMPNQRKMYAAATAGGEVDPRLSYQAKRRSKHNNYLTLPVIFMMISNHFSMTWGHAMNWLILVAMFLVGIGVDHFLNSRDKGQKGIGYAALAAAFAALIAAMAISAVP
ncbi:MAG TPA: urate hydroxylase PuuD, partial [Rudaea sp.]|nr:urate hydroxylase PuuD [Rudaea sp.]